MAANNFSRKEIIEKVKKNFGIRELVCSHVYNKWGDRAWMFLDTVLLYIIYVLRNDVVSAPMIVNNWSSGGSYSQRGLRCNLCAEAKAKTDKGTLYLSAHCLGKAIDFTVSGVDAETIRNKIRSYWKSHDELPPIRLETGVSWVHIDVYDSGTDNKITEFSE